MRLPDQIIISTLDRRTGLQSLDMQYCIKTSAIEIQHTRQFFTDSKYFQSPFCDNWTHQLSLTSIPTSVRNSVKKKIFSDNYLLGKEKNEKQ